MKDPHNIIGKEIRAADGGNYGHRVISYDEITDKYTVQVICWTTKELLEEGRLRFVSPFKLSYRYKISSARDI